MTLQSHIMFPNSVYLYLKLLRLLALKIIPHSLYSSTLNSFGIAISFLKK